jgi:hypothetical protein
MFDRTRIIVGILLLAATLGAQEEPFFPMGAICS